MKSQVILFCLIIIFIEMGFSKNNSSESWIEYDDIAQISIGLTKEECSLILGEPLIVLANTEDSDYSSYLYYNYRIKSFSVKNNSTDLQKREIDSERMTLIKFTFNDGVLESWEEDKMTLSMSNKNNDSGFTFTVFNILLNIIVISLNAAVLMSVG